MAAVAGVALVATLPAVNAAPNASPASVMRELDLLAGRRAQLTRTIARSQVRIGVLNSAVAAGELRVHRDQAAQRRTRTQLAGLLVEQYKAPSVDSTAFLLASRSLAELVARADTLDRLSAAQAAAITAFTADAARVRAYVARATRLRRAVRAKLTSVTAARAAVDATIGARRELLARLTAATRSAVAHERDRRTALAHHDGGDANASPSGGTRSGGDGNPAGQTFTGEVTWYGPGFAGQPTASGETFDPSKLTAASPWLPFGTILRVTSTVTHASVTVRVNDRGPFGRGVLDLSQHAASVIGLSGWQVCRLQIVS